MSDPKKSGASPQRSIPPTPASKNAPPVVETQDIEDMRLPDVPVTKARIAVRSPLPNEAFRTSSSGGFPYRTKILQDGKDWYLAKPEFWPDLEKYGKCGEATLVPVITSKGDRLLWPISEAKGTAKTWSESKLAAAKAAEERWIKVMPVKEARSVVIEEVNPAPADPDWADLDVSTWIRDAFLSNFIDLADHKILKKLKGI
jgi:hypothetical protein